MERPESVNFDPPLLPRPKKNFPLFSMDEGQGHFPKAIFEGSMGDLPIFMAVNVGYDPEDEDPFMYPYESQEVLFAFKKDAQKRVLIQDTHCRTLSLPLSSPIRFRLRESETEMMLQEIVASKKLPFRTEFARAECLCFHVDKQTVSYSFFGDMVVSSVYEEPFMWCLAIGGAGGISDKITVLPRNLRDVCFAPIVGVTGAADPKVKVQEFIAKFSKHAETVDTSQDPFFKELAIVSRGPDLVFHPEPYIDNHTFVTVTVNQQRRPAPLAPTGHAPVLPPRKPYDKGDYAHYNWQKLMQKVVTDFKKQDQGEESAGEPEESDELPGYCVLRRSPSDEHVYNEPGEHMKGSVKTQVVKPLQAHGADTTLGDSKERPILPSRERKHSVDSTSGKSMGPPSVPPRPPLSSRADHSQLTIDDVADRLKRLGLERHVKKFRKNRIDGVLLEKLSERTLKAEFGMTQVEFLLLSTFVTEGHIPKSKNSSKSPKDKFGKIFSL